MARKSADDDATDDAPTLDEARFDAAIDAAADAVQPEIEAMLEEMDATVTDDKDGHHLILGALSDSAYYPHLKSYVAETLKQRLVDGDDSTPGERTDLVVELHGVHGLEAGERDAVVSDLGQMLADAVLEHHADAVDGVHATVRAVRN